MGIDQGSYSPHVQKQIVYAGVHNTSFAAGSKDLLNLARLKISEKQVERVSKRIGQERVDQRAKQVQAFLDLPMMEQFATPVAHPPDLAVVSMDGGRLQIRDWPSGEAAKSGAARESASAATAAAVASPAVAAEPPGEPRPTASMPRAEPVSLARYARSLPGAEAAIQARRSQLLAKAEPAREVRPTESPAVTEPAREVRPAELAPPLSQVRSGHWREDKIGLLMTMTSEESTVDPCPTIPQHFVNPLRILKLVRELRKGCPAGEDAVADPPEAEEENPLPCPEYTPPAVRVKSMVATRQAIQAFGAILAAAALREGSTRRGARRS